jgi:hypothetical protein
MRDFSGNNGLLRTKFGAVAEALSRTGHARRPIVPEADIADSRDT